MVSFTKEEIEFTESFICALRKVRVREFPFTFEDNRFGKGIERAIKSLKKDKSVRKESFEEISRLFIPEPYCGNYTLFFDAMSQHLGDNSGFYKKFPSKMALIESKIQFEYITEKVLEEYNSTISKESMLGIAREFYVGTQE